jgi:hypothetical protein
MKYSKIIKSSTIHGDAACLQGGGGSVENRKTVYLPSKAACTLLLRFKLVEETLGRMEEEVVRGPPVDEGGLVRLINTNDEAPAPTSTGN